MKSTTDHFEICLPTCALQHRNNADWPTMSDMNMIQ